ncbi:class I SAM-dependent methyltransferase [Mucilaginibacter pedocola]|uniref:Methyltransferase domain-containing protein n=1 Tax=Mucilaginibacter pedocola TaxID=1792845 RepID=A0A1S9PDR7_9SPHI|nr:class I SAM-dependent methyltransferase [Mucilaginibacter pedocola]OOQ59037.1 hypothetical protein BC343_29840 [Mucilaginibacter pedocola]
MASNYDNSASFYDGLSRLVFGNALVNAQRHYLPDIPPNSKVLIIGGGTGWILEEIAKVHPSGLEIVYVEISAKMMALSQKRNAGGNKVTFINKAVEEFTDEGFDVVITPFLFDNYTEKALGPTFNHIHQMLKASGLWLNIDFQLLGKWWQYAMLKSMLLFFKVLCGVESWRLPEIGSHFASNGYWLLKKKAFYGSFIGARVYRK